LIHVELSKGTRFAVLAVKEIINCLDRYIAGDPLKKGDTQYVALTVGGIPICLGPMINLVKKKDMNYLPWLRSLLSINRSIKLELRPDYSTITSPTTQVEGIPQHVIEKFVKHLHISKENAKVPEFKNFHYSNRSSPYGKHTHRNCILELLCLNDTLFEHIYTVGGDVLKNRMTFILSHYARVSTQVDILPDFDFVIKSLRKQFPKDFITKQGKEISLETDSEKIRFLKNYSRKIITFSEFEGKTRLIAMVDY
jgi:hypothetical protein